MPDPVYLMEGNTAKKVKFPEIHYKTGNLAYQVVSSVKFHSTLSLKCQLSCQISLQYISGFFFFAVQNSLSLSYTLTSGSGGVECVYVLAAVCWLRPGGSEVAQVDEGAAAGSSGRSHENLRVECFQLNTANLDSQLSGIRRNAQYRMVG